MTGDKQKRQKFGVFLESSPMNASASASSKSTGSATQYVGSPCDSPFSPSRQSSFVQIAIGLLGTLFYLFRPATLALFAHGLNFLEVFRPALGGCFTATATEGNGGWIFLCHARRLQKPLAVCQVMARESAQHGTNPTPRTGHYLCWSFGVGAENVD